MSRDEYRLGKLTRTRADGTTYWHWCIVWVDDEGRRHRQSLGTDVKAAAETQARAFWAALTLSGDITIGKIVEAYLDTLNGLKDEKRKREAWKAAKDFWAALKPGDIDEETGAAYIKWRKRALNTVRNELSTIRSAVRWATTQAAGNILAPDAVPPIRVPGMPESEVNHLTKAEFARFLKGCASPHVRLFAQLKVTTAARSTHLFELPWIRVDLKRKQINLKPVSAKRVEDIDAGKEASNKGRAIVPINDRLYDLLVEAKEAALSPYVIELNGGPIKSIKKGFEAASERSGVKCTPLMLRHSAAVWMAEARVPMGEIAAFLGHKDLRITARIYARYHPDYLQNAARALDWDDAGSSEQRSTGT